MKRTPLHLRPLHDSSVPRRGVRHRVVLAGSAPCQEPAPIDTTPLEKGNPSLVTWIDASGLREDEDDPWNFAGRPRRCPTQERVVASRSCGRAEPVNGLIP